MSNIIDMGPLSRKELYLAKMAGMDVVLPEPSTREEMFLAKMAGMDVPALEPSSRAEMLMRDATPASAGGGSDIDEFIENTITEINSNAKLVGVFGLQNRRALEVLNLPLAGVIDNNGVQNCIALKSVVLPKVTSVGEYAFQGCTSLEYIDFHALTSIGKRALAQTALKTIIIRSQQVCAADKETLYDMYGVSLYVPAALVETYKNTTGWGKCTVYAIEGSEYE